MNKNVLCLFAGAGGAVQGFKDAGFNVIAAVDFNEDCIATLRENHDDVQVIQADLAETSPQKFALEHDIAPNDIDVVVGGPPCKDFSVSNHDRSTNTERAKLVFDFIRYVSLYNPERFVMENVKGILSMDNGDFIDNILSKFEAIGYAINYDTLKCEKYGIPQKRERVVIIGSCNNLPKLPPETTPDNYVTVSFVTDDLPNLNSGESSDIPDHNAISHRDDTVEKLQDVEHGQSNHPARARAYPDDPAYTVIAGNLASAVHHRQPRQYTARETARLQTFPDTYTFPVDRRETYQQIGNALPPKMAEEIANSLYD